MNLSKNQISAFGLVPFVKELTPYAGSELVGAEIGVCRAHNMSYFLHEIENLQLIGIDPWTAYQDWCGWMDQAQVTGWFDEAMVRLQPYETRAVVLKNSSVDAREIIRESGLVLDFVFIDGDHSYNAVSRDLELYFTAVRDGGIVSGHDWPLDDVQKAVLDYREKNNITSEIYFCDNNCWFWYKNSV